MPQNPTINPLWLGELDETGKVQRGTYMFHAGIQQMFKRSSPERLFSSGIQQRLVMHRVSRFAGNVSISTSSRNGNTRHHLIVESTTRNARHHLLFLGLFLTDRLLCVSSCWTAWTCRRANFC